jgi:protein ImuB
VPEVVDESRVLVVECSNWSVTAAAPAVGLPAAVVRANRVIAHNLVAALDNVQVGLRRREAQARCPQLVVIEHDPSRDAREFESVVAANDALTPAIEVITPGRLAYGTRGPSRYWGGDDALAERAATLSTTALGSRRGGCADPAVGVAASRFAATLAARAALSVDRATLVVPTGDTPTFLAAFPVLTLADLGGVERSLVELLPRLGLRTLGQVAALGRPDLLARFGPGGLLMHRLATGDDDRPLGARRAPPDLQVQTELDPPAEQVDRVAFLAKVLADELHEALADRGLACTRIAIEAETEHGELHSRLWRHEGALSAAAIAERVRWQLDGWLRGGGETPTAGIARLRLVPDEVIPDAGRQLGFWGGQRDSDARALRAMARLTTIVGRESVLVPHWRGGRGAGEQMVLIPADTVDVLGRLDVGVIPSDRAPWPGQVPTPSPARVYDTPEAAEVTDGAGELVQVTGRALVTAEPMRLRIGTGPWRTIAAWAGPWCAQERWWDPEAHRRRARFQLIDDTGRAVLAAVEHGRWWIEADYD